MTRRTRTQIHINIGQTAEYRHSSVGAALAANASVIARLIEEGRALRRAEAEPSTIPSSSSHPAVQHQNTTQH